MESAGLLQGASYILPLRWEADEGLEELAGYLLRLSGWLSVIVVDGSPYALFSCHALAFPPKVRHVAPQPRQGANGKVAGIMTGIALAEDELLVLADDDVRYDRATLQQVLGLLEDADVVRPQNYFLALPWHAQWDTARTLVNRAFSADYPGTLAVRRSALLATGGYDGDVLFENLELLRTIRAAGGRELCAKDVFVGRIPPRTGHFLRQRVRQAYDDFAQPARLAVELSVLPLILATGYQAVRRGSAHHGAGHYLAAHHRAGRRRRPVAALTILAAVAVAAAETGRRKDGGQHFFGPSAALWAPLWLLERSVCIWAAVALRCTGGVRYAGTRLRLAANSPATLRERYAGKISTSRTEKSDHV
ncbi:glycosyltransferase family 2 protein [Paenarthrobacter sp. PH39-S1]|uniref:glycosyltransferase n=1 Tax=Paenarthrobacter sp. PH39-S1 TaxID=3046204 RepID=UPI0024BB8307|nr:glycosyltransferase family 2 protein [Paenarthrobacter sp. PH39-S1]MDJ0357782.1 glycosyltransferase family 2 protein [Paenarthrobacter sp. PH39-S1]